MNKHSLPAISLFVFFLFSNSAGFAAQRYFAHDAVEDSHGVIAPWYQSLNGQCDFRVRVAAEVMKRYPWATNPKTGLPAPHYIYNGWWKIEPDGAIAARDTTPWHNGDLVQRCTYAMFGLIDYYRYSGDPAAIAHISMMNDVILRFALTGADHPWPRFPVSVASRGELYGRAHPEGMIQLDLAAFYAEALVRAYELTGNQEWFDAAKHWGEVFAAKRNRKPGEPPWNRYANPEHVMWNDVQTGGVIMLLRFFDELIRAGYSGKNNSIVEARDAARAYLRDVLLPRWLEDDTWGREYWDWEHYVQGETFSEMVPRYMMNHPDVFPNWRTDARNIMSLYLHRSCVSPKSNGDVYSGAWSYPEGSDCCRRSLDYAPMQVGAAFAEYGTRANSEWAREITRRKLILATYDFHETGVVEDIMDGGADVAAGWFQCAHALPLKYVLFAIGWLPESLGANRENHIVRSSSVVNHVVYGRGSITYTTFDAPKNSVDVLRLAFRPTRITANGRALKQRSALDANGYTTRELPNGDCIVSIRHDGRTKIVVEGEDPQKCLAQSAIQFSGQWSAAVPAAAASEQKASGISLGRVEVGSAAAGTAALRVTSETNAVMTCTFEGNQMRLIGSVGPEGGLADVYLDGVKQLCGVDFWNPYRLGQQVVFYRNGLTNGQHTLRIVALGSENPRSNGAKVALEAVQFSAATGDAGFGEGGGPTEPQRWIFGYPERQKYVDAAGHAWLPATEVVIRAGARTDPVPLNWHISPRRQFISGTADPVLYRHGMHGTNFVAYFTVGPGTYHVRVKLMESRLMNADKRAMNIAINGQVLVRGMDIAATAATQATRVFFPLLDYKRGWEGINRAVDLVFNDIKPEHGVIAVRFTGVDGADALVSAIEVGPGPGGEGVKPVAAARPAKDTAK